DVGGQHLTPGAQPPSATGRTLAPEVTTLGEGGAAGRAASEPLSPLVHLRAPSSHRSGGGGPGGSEWPAGGRGAQPRSGRNTGSRGGSCPMGHEPGTGRPSARSAVPPAGSPPLPPSLWAEASGRLWTGSWPPFPPLFQLPAGPLQRSSLYLQRLPRLEVRGAEQRGHAPPAPRGSSQIRWPSCRKSRWIHSRLLTREEVLILSQEECRDNREKEKAQRGLLGHRGPREVSSDAELLGQAAYKGRENEGAEYSLG
ncbi:hypothetical protein E2I00_019511, partial [Balaenoptera physalus]